MKYGPGSIVVLKDARVIYIVSDEKAGKYMVVDTQDGEGKCFAIKKSQIAHSYGVADMTGKLSP